MRKTISIRMPSELVEWIEETSRRTGQSAGRVVREQLERARHEKGRKRFLRLAGKIAGPANLSSRKGFSRS